MSERTREEHMQWCKDRACELIDAGDLQGAFASMCSDVGKHPETKGHVEFTNQMGMGQLVNGNLDTPEKMRKWILGYN